MIVFLILKIVVVVIFLFFFLRRPTIIWGIGLLTVTTAVLLDTFLGTFGREQMQAELGFFFPVLSGMLFAGAAVWLWGMLRPLTAVGAPPPAAAAAVPPPPPRREPPLPADNAFDRQMLYDQIRTRFGREDVQDLMFDLQIGENEVTTLHQDMNQVILNVMDVAEARGETGDLALAVERILTPVPAEHLPRLEKLGVNSPPTILRQYLLAHYAQAQLAEMAARLGIDWEQVARGTKKTAVREFLLFLYRRNRLDELIALLQEGVTDASEE